MGDTINVEIHGTILDVDVSEDEFNTQFLEWLGSKGWAFGGGTSVEGE
jgi:hypothetical protein